MYEKYEVAVPMRGRQEMCDKMIKEVVFKGRNQGDIEKIKAESRRWISTSSAISGGWRGFCARGFGVCRAESRV